MRYQRHDDPVDDVLHTFTLVPHLTDNAHCPYSGR